VSTRVNAARNEGPELIEPVEIADEPNEPEREQAGPGTEADTDGQASLF
jgi:hypothetical protein